MGLGWLILGGKKFPGMKGRKRFAKTSENQFQGPVAAKKAVKERVREGQGLKMSQSQKGKG